MTLTRAFLRPPRTFGNIACESCLFRSLVLRLIVLCLPVLTACGAEEDFQSERPTAEPVAQVNSEEGSSAPPEGTFEGERPTAEPSIRFNFEGVMEDVVTATPKGNIQNEPREAEQTYSPM